LTRVPHFTTLQKAQRELLDDRHTHGQRWRIETVMFLFKRHQGEALTARKQDTRHHELGLTALTHNIMIVRV